MMKVCKKCIKMSSPTRCRPEFSHFMGRVDRQASGLPFRAQVLGRGYTAHSKPDSRSVSIFKVKMKLFKVSLGAKPDGRVTAGRNAQQLGPWWGRSAGQWTCEAGSGQRPLPGCAAHRRFAGTRQPRAPLPKMKASVPNHLPATASRARSQMLTR